MLFQVIGAIAEFERKLIRGYLTAGLRRAREKGRRGEGWDALKWSSTSTRLKSSERKDSRTGRSPYG